MYIGARIKRQPCEKSRCGVCAALCCERLLSAAGTAAVVYYRPSFNIATLDAYRINL
jgi:hypothetical protein